LWKTSRNIIFLHFFTTILKHLYWRCSFN